MIRLATIEDVSDIISLGIEFAHKSESVHRLSVNEDKIRDFTRLNILNPNVICLVLVIENVVQGFIWGMITEVFFSNDRIFQEMSLYSRKSGIKLIDALEEEVKKRGIHKIVMGSKPTFCDLGKIYRRKGYTIMEEHYIRTLEGV